MSHKVRAVIARGKGLAVSVETIVVPVPVPGEALVQVQACGVCHTDLHYRDGGINDDFLFLLGHEAAGIVEAVGPAREADGRGDQAASRPSARRRSDSMNPAFLTERPKDAGCKHGRDTRRLLPRFGTDAVSIPNDTPGLHHSRIARLITSRALSSASTHVGKRSSQ